MTALQLFAGPTALRRIQQEGLNADMFRLVVGASGGPKWFVLYGLDRYLFSDFFARMTHPLATLGSSAGAWRLACLGTADPVAAIDRLALNYSRQRYSAKPDIREISKEARSLVDIVLGATGAAEIANNQDVSVHIVANRARGLLQSDRKALLASGLLLSASANAVLRRSLGMSFERVVFHGERALDALPHWRDLPTRAVQLQENNVREALLASGSIPMIMEGVRNIPGAPTGTYRDGGITDYHFDLPFMAGDGLVLYPHFYSRIIPGWFDKSLKWRKVNPLHFHNVLLVAPSPEFVRSLPHGKIPDRNDFVTMDYESRLSYWQTVLRESERLADDFEQVVKSGDAGASVRPFSEAPGN